jgi:isopentenyl-diphosphate Delta-isomerase
MAASMHEGPGAGEPPMSPTSLRKKEHVDINLEERVQTVRSYWDEVHPVHQAVPEVDYYEVPLGLKFLGKSLGAPLMIASMTGGYPGAEAINRALSFAASEHRLAIGVGSQRAALKDPGTKRSFTAVRDHDVPFVAANIGLPQLIQQRSGKPLTFDEIDALLSMLEADALIVHLNYLQEAVQPGGDLNAKGGLQAIRKVVDKVGVPVIAKETGAGISRQAAAALAKAGVAAIDVGGTGGTSFAAVELFRAQRAGEAKLARIGELYRDWGVPTVVSVVEARGAKVEVPLIATGGVDDGLKTFKALALGATMAGMANAAMKAAVKGEKECSAFLGQVLDELRTAMLLTGSASLADCAKAPLVITGHTSEWLRALGHDPLRFGAGRSRSRGRGRKA